MTGTTSFANFGERTHQTSWAIGDTVTLDNDPVQVRVTAVCIRDRGHQYEVSWFDDGRSHTAWVEDWRMHTVEERQAGFHRD